MSSDASLLFEAPSGTVYRPPDGIADIKERMCGCGRNIDVWRVFCERLLGWIWQNDTKPCSSGPEWWIVYTASDLGWIEHGSSLPWGWLRPPGWMALSFLLEFGPPWSFWAPLNRNKWHDDRDGGWMYEDSSRTDPVEYGWPADRCFCDTSLPADSLVEPGDEHWCDQCEAMWTATEPGGGRWRPPHNTNRILRYK